MKKSFYFKFFLTLLIFLIPAIFFVTLKVNGFHDKTQELAEQLMAVDGSLTSPPTDEAPKKDTDRPEGLFKGITYDLSNTAYTYKIMMWAAILSVALTFAAIGAFSSIIPRALASEGGSGRLETKSLSDNFILFISVSSISGILSICLFAGGLVSGALFPNFDSSAGHLMELEFTGDEWFKLAVWSYISGFYERFIPGLLEGLLTRQEKKSELPDDRSEAGARRQETELDSDTEKPLQNGS